ncbi:hypothetical protein WAE61_09490 [Comamonadaceae bacterium PP-2]
MPRLNTSPSDADPPRPQPVDPGRRRWLPATLWLLAGLVLGAVFMLYTRPDLVLTLGQQMWSCFGGSVR